MPANGVIEPLDVIEDVGSGLIPCSIHLACCSLGLSEEKKLSMAALSQTLPERLIEQLTPLSAISFWNCSLVYWLPWSPFCLSSGDLGLVDRGVAARDQVEDLASDVALQGPNGFELRVPFSDAFGHVDLGFRIGS